MCFVGQQGRGLDRERCGTTVGTLCCLEPGWPTPCLRCKIGLVHCTLQGSFSPAYITSYRCDSCDNYKFDHSACGPEWTCCLHGVKGTAGPS